MFIKLPKKHILFIEAGVIALDYVPEGKDPRDRLLLMKRKWAARIPFTKRPEGAL